jgi:regulator of sigma E protease
MLTTILATAIVLGVLIFVHELGHFMTAKLVGIGVERFSIGFGPRLIGFRRGETEYVISLLPLGGYVKMAGMEEMEPLEGGSAEREEGGPMARDGGVLAATDSEPGNASPAGDELIGNSARGSRDFDSKSIPARALVLSAGVLMNVFFAILVFAASALFWGVPIEPEAKLPAVAAAALPAGAAPLSEVPAGTRVTALGNTAIEDWGDLRDALITATPGPVVFHFEQAAPVTIEVPASDSLRFALVQALEPGRQPIVGEVLAGGPAAQAGIRSGDKIGSVDGQVIGSWPQLVSAIEARPGEAVAVGLERDGQNLTLQVVPRAETIAAADDGERVVGRIGIGESPRSLPRERPGVGGAVVHGVERTWGAAEMITKALGDLVTGKVSARAMGGPILVGQLSGQVARVGLEPFLAFMALFSVNLAILNLLPIPVLDGGHLALLGIEAVRGRALSIEMRGRLMQVGFVIVLAIMVWAVGNDILRLFGF